MFKATHLLMLRVAASFPLLIPRSIARRVLVNFFRYNPRDYWGSRVVTLVGTGEKGAVIFSVTYREDDTVLYGGGGKSPLDAYIYRCAVGVSMSEQELEALESAMVEADLKMRAAERAREEEEDAYWAEEEDAYWDKADRLSAEDALWTEDLQRQYDNLID